MGVVASFGIFHFCRRNGGAGGVAAGVGSASLSGSYHSGFSMHEGNGEFGGGGWVSGYVLREIKV